jgi:hypothetical protein
MLNTQHNLTTVSVPLGTETEMISGVKRSREPQEEFAEAVNKEQSAEAVTKYEPQKEAKMALRESRKKLLVCLDSFQRHFELEAAVEVDQDAMGVLGYMEKGKFFGCPISAVAFLLEHDELDLVNEESDVKLFSESEYGPISDFPSQLKRIGTKFLHAADLADKAKLQDVLPGDMEDTTACEGSSGESEEEIDE